MALGRDGGRGLGADSQAEGQRPRGRCLAKPGGLITLGPRPWGVRQACERGGPQQPAVPRVRDKPGRTRPEPPRRWQGQRVRRRVAVAEAEGRHDMAARRWLGVPSRPVAQQAAAAYAAAHPKEAERVTEHWQRVAARWGAWAADAAAAMAADDGRGQGRRGRQPPPWRSPPRRARREEVTPRQQRTPRGRPPKAAGPQATLRSRLRSGGEAQVPSADTPGGSGLATTVGVERCTEAELLQAYQEQQTTGAPGVRWLQNPAAISPVWLEQPQRMAALARRTVVGWLG